MCFSSHAKVVNTRPFLLFVLWLGSVGFIPLFAQNLNDTGRESASREEAIAERFLEVLLRRPRPGVALDRLYGHHVQAGTIDDLLRQLRVEAKESEGDAAAKWMLIGLIELERGADSSAADSLANAERLGADPMAAYYLGQALLRLGKTAEAAAALERASERQPERSAALTIFTELGRIYSREQQTDKALTVWNRLEALFPGDRRVGEQIARTLAEEGQLEAALDRYLKLIETGNADQAFQTISFSIMAAELKRKLGRDSEALSDLELLLPRLRPGSWLHDDVRQRIETLVLGGGNYNALADYYAAQIEQNGGDLDTRLRLGRALAEAGRINESIDMLSLAVKDAPGDEEVRLALVDVLRRADEHARVVEQLRMLCEQAPDNPDYRVQLGHAVLNSSSGTLQERRAAAAQVWQQLANRQPDDPVTIAQVADLLRGVDESEQALRLYRQTITLAPEQSQYREYLGEYLHELGRIEEAKEVWKTIAAGERRNRDTLVRLAEVFTTFAMLQDSLTAFREAAEFDLTFRQRLRFADLLLEDDRFEEALSQLDAGESMAETEDEHEQILHARVECYTQSGSLERQIDELRQKSLSESAVADDFRKLALMEYAAGRSAPALAAIARARALAPRTTNVLRLAAQLYNEQGHDRDAIRIYQTLIDVDKRLESTYALQIGQMQMRLGEIDDALATMRALINKVPNDPSHYQTYAEYCFRAGRDEEGVVMLRRGLEVLPRNNDLRLLLASNLARRYFTAEAIELYWQVFEADNDIEHQQSIIALLVPLYERQLAFDKLCARINDYGRDAVTSRRAALLLSAAYERIDNLNKACTALDARLLEYPRDLELLTRLSRLSELAGEVERALEYQRRIIAIASTPENKSRLLALMIETGNAEGVLTTLRESGGFDEGSVDRLIEQLITRRDYVAAAAFCTEALKQDANRWEVKIRLAVCLLLDSDLANDDQAIRVASEILASPPPIQKPVLTQSTSTTNATSVPPGYMATNNGTFYRIPHTQYLNDVVRFLNRQQRVVLSLGSPPSTQATWSMPPFTTREQARIFAAGVIVAAAANRSTEDEIFAAHFLTGDPEEADDAEALLTLYNATYLRHQLVDVFSETAWPNDTAKRIARRLVTLDPPRGLALFYNDVLLSRASPSAARRPADTGLPPLPDEELKLLPLVVDYLDGIAKQYTDVELYAAVYLEWVRAGDVDSAHKLASRFKELADTSGEFANAVEFFREVGRLTDATDILVRARKMTSSTATLPSPTDLQRLGASALVLAAQSENHAAWKERMQDGIHFYGLASKFQPAGTLSTSAPIRERVQVTRVEDGRLHIANLQVPIAPGLMDSEFVRLLYRATAPDSRFGWQRRAVLHWLSADATPEALIPEQEILRDCARAFTALWHNDPSMGYRIMSRLVAKFDDNAALKIEAARFAVELNRPQRALELLDSVDVADPATTRIRELAALNLADQLNDRQRAELAAERLQQAQLNPDLQLAVSDRLSSLGLQRHAKPMLRQLGRSTRDSSQLIQIAKQLQSAGESEAAAEAAQEVVRNTIRGLDVRTNQHLRAAVQLLEQLDRLEAVFEWAEARAANAPESYRIQKELANLYVAAGRRKEAREQTEKAVQLEPEGMRNPIAAAQHYTARGLQSFAVNAYLKAFQDDHSLIARNFHHLAKAAQQSRQIEQVYEAMHDWDLSQVPLNGFVGLIRMKAGSRQSLSPAGVALMAKALEIYPRQSLPELIRLAGRDSQLAQSPEIASVIERFFADPAFYNLNSAYWQTTTSRNTTEFGGILIPSLRLIAQNSDLEVKLRRILTERAGTERDRVVAQAVLFGFDVHHGVQEGIPKRSTELIELLNEETQPVAAARILRMLAQLCGDRSNLESTEIRFYEAVRDFGPRPSDFAKSVEMRLVELYLRTGQREKAIAEIMRTFRESTAPERRTPIYSRYERELFADWLAAAKELRAAEAPFEALEIYQHGLADPERLANVDLYHRGENLEVGFAQELQQAFGEVSQADRVKYLERLTVSLAQPGENVLPLRIGAFGPGDTTTGMQSSIAAFAILGLHDTPSATKTLSELNVALQTAADSVSGEEKFSHLVFSFLTALKLDPSTAVLPLEELRQLIVRSHEAQVAVEPRTILGLYGVVLVALESESPDIIEAGGKLSEQVVAVARIHRASEHILTILRAEREAGYQSETTRHVLLALLEWIVPLSGQPQAISQKDAAKCLEIAVLANQLHEPEVSMNAVTRALAGGSPQSEASGQATAVTTFLPQQNQRSSVGYLSTSRMIRAGRITRTVPVESIDTGLRDLTRKANEVAGTWQSYGATPETIYQTLRSIVLPSGKDTAVLRYTLPLFSMRSEARFVDGQLSAASLGGQLVEAAVAAGKKEDLYSTLTQRRSRLEDTRDVDVLLLQLAVASDDEEAIAEALTGFDESVGAELPAHEELASLRPTTVPTYASSDSARTLLIDAVLHSTAPLLQSEHPNRAADHLALRALGLARLEPEALRISIAATDWVFDRLIARIRKSPGESLNSILRLRHTLLIARYARYRSDDAVREIAKARSQLAMSAMEFGEWELAGDLFRDVAGKGGLPATIDEPSIAAVATSLVEAPSEGRYEVLWRITFGSEPNQPFVDWQGLVDYDRPPVALRPITPAFARVTKLNDAHRDLPLISSATLLIDAAVAQGNATPLLAELERRVESPGDEFEALIAILRLQQPGSTEFDAGLSRVHQRIRGVLNAERQTFPVAAAILAARCLQHDPGMKSALALAESLRDLANQAGSLHAASCMNQLLARHGTTRAAGGTPGSPLKHWVVAELPGEGRPRSQTRRPLFRADQNAVYATGGSGHTWLLLKYPVSPNITYRHHPRSVRQRELGIAYGGVEYRIDHATKFSPVLGPFRRGQFDFPGAWDRKAESAVHELEVSHSSVKSHYGEKLVSTDWPRLGMPFLGVAFSMADVAEFEQISVEGELLVPRTVDLITPTLTGWGTPIYGGALPDLLLPIPSTMNATSIMRRRQQRIERAKTLTWYVADDQLQTGEAVYPAPGDMKHISYLRPLCAGEKIAYEFKYVPGEFEVHPTIGRTALLLRPEGLRLRWLVQPASLESLGTNPLNETEPKSGLLTADEDPSLIAGEWNRVALAADDRGEGITVIVNGQPLFRLPVESPPSFGFLTESGRHADVRSLQLTGPWPKNLPANLLAPSE